MNISDRVGIRNAKTLNLQLKDFLFHTVSQLPLGKGQLGPGILLCSQGKCLRGSRGRSLPWGPSGEGGPTSKYRGGMRRFQACYILK